MAAIRSITVATGTRERRAISSNGSRTKPSISEDKIEGFVREPFEEIARRSRVPVATVMERIAAMLRAGTVRRVRQTLLATNLADGALVAWKVAPEKIEAAFDY